MTLTWRHNQLGHLTEFAMENTSLIYFMYACNSAEVVISTVVSGHLP